MEPHPSYVSLYRKFMGIYGILNRFILWSTNKPFQLKTRRLNFAFECSQCLTNHAKRLDLTRWIRSTEKPLLEKSMKLLIFSSLHWKFRKEWDCPKSLSRRFSAEICSKRKLVFHFSNLVSILDTEVFRGNFLPWK